ncbi:CBS domain-containing protein [Rubrivirga marina]|nr:CBS domain-containing protein [Rubrivirga marina]
MTARTATAPMTVADWMTPDPAAVAPEAGLIEIRALFRSRRFHHVPVVEDGRPVGVVSDRDVLAAISPFLDTPAETHRDVDTLARTAADLMTTDLQTVGLDVPLAEASRQMVEAEVSSLLVVDEDGALAGILTVRDVLRASAG